MAMALMASLPLVVLFLFLQRFFVEGLARSGLK
jgi:multiple sugar transport system permease protein